MTMTDTEIFPPTESLSDLLKYLTDGFDQRAGEEVTELVSDMEQLAQDGLRASKGVISLELTVKRANDGSYEVTPNLKIKTPRMPTTRTVMWATRGNGLTIANPAQRDMFRRRPTLPRTGPQSDA